MKTFKWSFFGSGRWWSCYWNHLIWRWLVFTGQWNKLIMLTVVFWLEWRGFFLDEPMQMYDRRIGSSCYDSWDKMNLDVTPHLLLWVICAFAVLGKRKSFWTKVSWGKGQLHCAEMKLLPVPRFPIRPMNWRDFGFLVILRRISLNGALESQPSWGAKISQWMLPETQYESVYTWTQHTTTQMMYLVSSIKILEKYFHLAEVTILSESLYWEFCHLY